MLAYDETRTRKCRSGGRNTGETANEFLSETGNGLSGPCERTGNGRGENRGRKEKKRSGGNGLYYHNSYWAPPGMSYVFLCSIPLAHTAYELGKAWQEGIRKLWVINTGAMKPLEQEIEFFLRLAWEAGKESAPRFGALSGKREKPLSQDVDAYVADWIGRNFSGGIGARTAKLLNDFSQLTNVRKIENMDDDAFSQTAYGDEAAVRIHKYEELFETGNAIYAELPEKERDAFFELALMRIHAAYFTNLAYYYGDRSTLACRQGKSAAAAEYVRRCREMDDARRKMLVYYNKRMAQGKWDGILDPEGFPPPRAAMLPACTPPLPEEMRARRGTGTKESAGETSGEAKGAAAQNGWKSETERNRRRKGWTLRSRLRTGSACLRSAARYGRKRAF